MVKNYLKVALRHLQKQLLYSGLNILGLAIGIASSFILLLYVYQELSYEHGFGNSNRIYRIGTSFYNAGPFAHGPEYLIEVLRADVPEVQRATRVQRQAQMAVHLVGQYFEGNDVYFTDSSFFKIFNYPFLEGNPATALQEQNSLILTEKLATKYFGNSSALGKTLELGQEKEAYIITGVVAQPPFKSHLKPSMWVANYSSLSGNQQWASASFYNYVLLNQNVSEEQFETALDEVIKKYVYPALANNMDYEIWKQSEIAYKFHPQPLEDIYLKSKFKFELSPGGNESNVYIFLVIGLFIILIAAMNFINLSTARAANRAKEVGLRKTFGTTRASLVFQFLLESMLTSILALLLAFGLAELFLIIFESITGEVLVSGIWNNWQLILAALSFALLIGFLSGMYPAFYMTAFRPVLVLKGSHISYKGKEGFRNVLVTLQFTISACLILCTLVILQQLNFIKAKDLGFNKENVLVIENMEALKNNKEAFRQDIARHVSVEYSSFNERLPIGNTYSIYTYKTPQMEESLSFHVFTADYDFIPSLNIELIEGRNFSRDFPSDSNAVILNEAAVKALNLKEPIGTILNEGETVIGVVRNFNFESLRNEVAPATIRLKPSGHQLAIKLRGADIPEFLTTLQNKWQNYEAAEPIQYYFLDDNFAKLMAKEQVLGKAISFFTGLAIFIACLGLFGLAAYTAEQRTKEIGIRKVLGASVVDVLLMLNKKYVLLILIAIGMAIPLALYLMQKWLENFAYRINLSWWISLLSITLVMIIAILTVSFQSVKAAMANPVDALRTE